VAEVKVKVTAQNETRTGFQQALNEAKSFGAEATRATTIDDEAALAPLRKIQQQIRDLRAQARAPIDAAPAEQAAADGGVATTSATVSGSLRGLATDLANATSPAQAFEAILNRVSAAMGGLVAATAGFAIGSVIRRTLEDAAAGLNSLIDQSESLQQKFGNLLAPTTTFSQLASAVQTAAAEIEALKKANEELQSGFGFQLADYLSTYDLSTTANQVAEGGEQAAKVAGTTAILAMMQRENQLAKARTDEERTLIGLQAQREQFRAQAVKAFGPQAGEASDRLFAAQDARGEIDKERDSAKAEASLQAQADKQRAINQDNKRSLEERLTREKQGLADLEQFGGAGVDLAREQSVAKIAELEKQIASEKERAEATAQREAEQREKAIERDTQSLAGLKRGAQTPEDRRASLQGEQSALLDNISSLAPDDFAGRAQAIAEAQRISNEMQALGGQKGSGVSAASGLQRIGFASDEFVNARPEDKTAESLKRSNDFIKQIIDLLKNPNTLVMKSEF
jgi:hypothetical protein